MWRFLPLALLLSPAALAAQLPIPLAIEGQIGYSVPAGDFGDADGGLAAEAGPAFSVGARLDATEALGVFAAYRQERFGCESCELFQIEDDATLKGVEVGLRLVPPVEVMGVRPWVRGAVLRESLGFSDGDESLDTDAGTGFSAATGVTVPIGEGLELSPGLRYIKVPVEFSFPITSRPDRSLDVTAIGFDVSLAYRF